MADHNEKEKTPEPFIHESENFISAYFGKLPEDVVKEVSGKPDKKLISSLVAQLTDTNQKELKIEVLKLLKNGNSQPLLVSIISMIDYEKHKTALIAACWETCLDFSPYLYFFTEQAIKSDYLSCVEAMTVITENMIGPFENSKIELAKEVLTAALPKAKDKEPILRIILSKLDEFSQMTSAI